MAFKFNPFTGLADVVTKALILAASDPAYSGIPFLINTTTNELKVYYAGSWQVIATLSGSGVASILLMENGDRVALENGDLLQIE